MIAAGATISTLDFALVALPFEGIVVRAVHVSREDCCCGKVPAKNDCRRRGRAWSQRRSALAVGQEGCSRNRHRRLPLSMVLSRSNGEGKVTQGGDGKRLTTSEVGKQASKQVCLCEQVPYTKTRPQRPAKPHQRVRGGTPPPLACNISTITPSDSSKLKLEHASTVASNLYFLVCQ